MIDFSGQSYSIPTGTIGTFQARVDPSAPIPPPVNQPDPIIIDAIFNGQKIVFRPKSYVPNGNIKPLILSSNEFKLLPADKLVSVKENSMSNIDGNGNIDIPFEVVSKTSSYKYIKQRDFILTLTALGALSGFSRAKLLKGSASKIAITTLIYGGVAALASWGLASLINDK